MLPLTSVAAVMTLLVPNPESAMDKASSFLSLTFRSGTIDNTSPNTVPIDVKKVENTFSYMFACIETSIHRINADPMCTCIPYSCVVKRMRLYLHRKKSCAYTRGALNSELRVN